MYSAQPSIAVHYSKKLKKKKKKEYFIKPTIKIIFLSLSFFFPFPLHRLSSNQVLGMCDTPFACVWFLPLALLVCLFVCSFVFSLFFCSFFLFFVDFLWVLVTVVGLWLCWWFPWLWWWLWLCFSCWMKYYFIVVFILFYCIKS